MALYVEVSGYGMCHYPPELGSESHSVLVVCLQQENFQAWTVYRRYSQFAILAEQLQTMYTDIVPIPQFDETDFSVENLELCRTAMNKWLQLVTSNPNVLRTQSMYQFLCFDANMPPPYLEITWRSSMNGSFDEMEMDEMFEKQLEDQEGGLGDESQMWTPDEDDGGNGGGGGVGVWRGAGGGAAPIQQQQQQKQQHQHQQQHQQQQQHPGSTGGGRGTRRLSGGKGGPGGGRGGAKRIPQAQKEDGLDIQSLSVGQAEFMYNRADYEEAGVDGTAANSYIMASSLGGGLAGSLMGRTPPLQQVLMSCPDDPVDTNAAKKMINLDTFHIVKVIGRGSFGKVFLVRHKQHGTLHALKVLKKDFIIRKNQVEHTRTERSVLGYVHHPFIVGLTMAFQTSDKLFFVLDYCSGGELFFHLGKTGRFTEERARFYAAQITLALEYIHHLGVIYRDLKPENVLLDDMGNVRLTDFGLSKESVYGPSSGASSFCGTPEYIAPEVLKRQGHGRAVDWWSLGALLFEMITGLPPFYSRNRETMFDKIMKAELTFPQFMSEESQDLLSKLLVRDPNHRLGSGDRDAMAVKEHPFFRDIDWDALIQGRCTPPWAPDKMGGSLDTSHFDEEFTSMMPAVSPDVRGAYFGSLDRAFEGFSYIDESSARAMQQAATANENAMSAGTGAGVGGMAAGAAKASSDGGGAAHSLGQRGKR